VLDRICRRSVDARDRRPMQGRAGRFIGRLRSARRARVSGDVALEVELG